MRNITLIDSFSLLVSTKPEYFLSLFFFLGIKNMSPLFDFSLISYPAITTEELLITLDWQERLTEF
jgi:hypothetical protein